MTAKTLKLAPETAAKPEIQVSPHSKWSDEVWTFTPLRAGQAQYDSVIRWGISIGDGETLLSPGQETLLETFRLLAWSCLQGHSDAPAKKPPTVLQFLLRLANAIRWMRKNGSSLSSFDSQASWRYLKSQIAPDGKPASISQAGIRHLADALNTAYHHRKAVLDAGIPFLPEAPFDGLPISSSAIQKIDAKEDGWIEPLPDPVALKILRTSMEWLEEPLSDIIRLRDELLSLVSKKRALRGTRAFAALRLYEEIEKFQFSKRGEIPWREPITPGSDISYETGKPITRTETAVRALISDATAACVCLLQGTTGMRVSEIAAIRSGIDPKTGLPASIRIRKSKSGLSELFFLSSQAEKIHDGKHLEWLAGMRPAGSDYLPPAILALLALEKLHKPWREMAKMDDLLVSYGDRGRNLAMDASGVSPITSNGILSSCKAFIARQCGLSELPDTIFGSIDLRPYKDGSGFKTHQWRKTFALYVLRSDPKMLPALSQHFKHMSLAMTEQGYIGNDPELLESIDSARRQRTVQFLVEQSTGLAPIAGGMAELVREQRKSLEDMRKNGTIESWVVESDLRIWFSDYGKCFVSISPGESRCHALGKTDPWLSAHPNYEHRSPSACCGCKCFAVDAEHRDFWERRMTENQSILDSAEDRFRPEYRVAQERVAQAKAILRALDEPPIPLTETNHEPKP